MRCPHAMTEDSGKIVCAKTRTECPNGGCSRECEIVQEECRNGMR